MRPTVPLRAPAGCPLSMPRRSGRGERRAGSPRGANAHVADVLGRILVLALLVAALAPAAAAAPRYLRFEGVAWGEPAEVWVRFEDEQQDALPIETYERYGSLDGTDIWFIGTYDGVPVRRRTDPSHFTSIRVTDERQPGRSDRWEMWSSSYEGCVDGPFLDCGEVFQQVVVTGANDSILRASLPRTPADFARFDSARYEIIHFYEYGNQILLSAILDPTPAPEPSRGPLLAAGVAALLLAARRRRAAKTTPQVRSAAALGLAAIAASASTAQTVTIEQVADDHRALPVLDSSGDMAIVDYPAVWFKPSGAARELVLAAGDPAPGVPGAVVHDYFLQPMIGAGGQIVIHGWAAIGSERRAVVWQRSTDGTVSPVLLEGDPVPDHPPSDTFTSFILHTHVGGSSLVTAEFDIGATGDEAHVLLRIDDTGGITPVIEKGAEPPGVTPGETLGSIGSARLTTDGGVAFSGYVVDDAGMTDPLSDQAIWATSTSGAFELIAREGSAAPGTSGAHFRALQGLQMAPTGDIAFLSGLIVGTGDAVLGNDWGIWRRPAGGALSLALRIGDAAPGTTSTFLSIENLTQSETGDLAFYGFLDHVGGVDSTADEGIWVMDGAGVVSLVVQEGDPRLMMPAGSQLDRLFPSGLNSLGQVAITLQYEAGAGDFDVMNDSALFLASADGDWVRIAQEGELGPPSVGGPGVGSGRFARSGRRFLNDIPQVVFNLHIGFVGGPVFVATITPDAP